MATAEAASSLFGDSDESPDFFISVQDQENTESSSHPPSESASLFPHLSTHSNSFIDLPETTYFTQPDPSIDSEQAVYTEHSDYYQSPHSYNQGGHPANVDEPYAYDLAYNGSLQVNDEGRPFGMPVYSGYANSASDLHHTSESNNLQTSSDIVYQSSRTPDSWYTHSTNGLPVSLDVNGTYSSVIVPQHLPSSTTSVYDPYRPNTISNIADSQASVPQHISFVNTYATRHPDTLSSDSVTRPSARGIEAWRSSDKKAYDPPMVQPKQSSLRSAKSTIVEHTSHSPTSDFSTQEQIFHPPNMSTITINSHVISNSSLAAIPADVASMASISSSFDSYGIPKGATVHDATDISYGFNSSNDVFGREVESMTADSSQPFDHFPVSDRSSSNDTAAISPTKHEYPLEVHTSGGELAPNYDPEGDVEATHAVAPHSSMFQDEWANNDYGEPLEMEQKTAADDQLKNEQGMQPTFPNPVGGDAFESGERISETVIARDAESGSVGNDAQAVSLLSDKPYSSYMSQVNYPFRDSQEQYDPYAPPKPRPQNADAYQPQQYSTTYIEPLPSLQESLYPEPSNHLAIEGLPYPSNRIDPSIHNSHDPYAPSNTRAIQPSEALFHELNPVPGILPDAKEISGHINNTSTVQAHFGMDHQTVIAPVYSQYAPSPSLLGSNDPLQRTSARIPVFTFGFGGKIATCFHLSQVSSGGFDVAMSSQETKNIRIRVLHEIIPSSMLESTTADTVFPGPLFADPGSVSTGIISTGTSANIKSKRGQLLKYLDERADEMEKGAAHLAQGSVERLKAESRLTLFRLLRVLVDNDGNFTGSPKAEDSVRQILTPNASGGTFSSPAPFNEQPLSVYTLRASTLTRLEELLLAGDRRQAYHYAVDEKLWAHALLIAHSLDKEAWNAVVKEFINSEIDQASHKSKGIMVGSGGNGTFEGLKMAYGLCGGLGALSLQQLTSPPTTIKPTASATVPVAPISPNFIPSVQASTATPATPETLSNWQNIAAMAFSTSTAGNSAALTSLGDHLAANHWIEAAHCCYLLSPHTSSLGGAGLASSRAVLLGLPSPMTGNFHKKSDSFMLTEIAEFALSLSSQSKNQEQFSGLAHLQAYRLIRAYQLADMGHTAIASRYCEAIGTSLRLSSRGSAYFTKPFLEHLKELSDRLTGAPHHERGKSWMIGKVAKPSLDTIGGWLEGRITRFIAGESDSPSMSENVEGLNRDFKPHASAFSGFTTISSANTSQSPSPSPSLQSQLPPSTYYGQHSVSRPPSVLQMDPKASVNRASSALEHFRPVRRASPVARIASASAAPPSSFDYSVPPIDASQKTTQISDGSSATSRYGSWWDTSNDTTRETPVSTTAFFNADSNAADGNFISLMDVNATPVQHSTHRYATESDKVEEDDLGLGNSKPKAIDADNELSLRDVVQSKSAKQGEVEVSEKPSETNQVSQSWLGWLWTRKNTPPTGPVKAKLGEESSFYYDKELKRWVNKKGPAENARPSPPPPPPNRQATAPPDSAPAYKSSFASVNPPRASAPPLRPASAAELPSQGDRLLGRARSNLVPTDTALSSAPPSPPSRLAAGTPPSRPKSSTTKRSIRSRYVDVLQQGQPP